MRSISMSTLLGSSYLTGATKAQGDLPKLIQELAKVNVGESVALDFKGIDHVSASYWNGTVPAVFSFTADEERDIFPIICNVKDESLEELGLALKSRGIAVPVANKEATSLNDLKLLGVIDPVHEETFNLVSSYGEVGASELASKDKHGRPGLSGWNNRLTTLYRMRLIRRVKQGRSFKYKPIVEV